MSELSDLGSANYHLFDRAVVLDRVMRQAGQDADQELFRDLLLRLRNGESSVGDWKQLMKRTAAEVGNVSSYVTLYRKIRHNAAPNFFSFFLPAESMMPEDRILQVRGQ